MSTGPTSVQATVRAHGPQGGTLLRDDGRPLAYPVEALDPTVRLLRSGQRVTARLADDGTTVLAVTLVGLPSA